MIQKLAEFLCLRITKANLIFDRFNNCSTIAGKNELWMNQFFRVQNLIKHMKILQDLLKPLEILQGLVVILHGL